MTIKIIDVCNCVRLFPFLLRLAFLIFIPASEPIWLDDVECLGTEPSLADCASSDFGDTNCHHYEDAGVRCTCEWTEKEEHVFRDTGVSVVLERIFFNRRKVNGLNAIAMQTSHGLNLP